MEGSESKRRPPIQISKFHDSHCRFILNQAKNITAVLSKFEANWFRGSKVMIRLTYGQT